MVNFLIPAVCELGKMSPSDITSTSDIFPCTSNIKLLIAFSSLQKVTNEHKNILQVNNIIHSNSRDFIS